MAPARQVLLLLVVAAAGASASRPLYLTPGAPVDDRVADLVARMTLDEKIAQLILPFGAKYPADYIKYNTTGLGATYPLPGGITTRNAWQTWQVNSTRLGIPTSFIGETLHSGYSGGTVFPMPSSQGASWNASLVQEIAAAIALEARTSGVDRGFSPVLHFCTDPRFGRCEESFGEDPALVAAMGVAAVTGLAGPGGPGAASTYLPDPTVHIATEAKHYAAYAYGGRDGSMPADVSEYTLFDVYLRPWRAYARAGGRGIMAAHNAVNGMPCHGNRALLTDALRNNFGFGGGLCASDAGDISHLTAYHIVPDKAAAGAWALNAGMDQELEKDGAMPLLPEALARGLVNMSTIDRAVGNVLRQKVASGLLDGRDDLLLVDPVRQAAVLDCPAHRELARRAAEEAAVLLRNDNARLPLTGLGAPGANGLRRIAILGPNANNTNSQMGGYTQGGAPVVTLLDAAVAAANASGNAFSISYERGACLGATPDCPCPNFTPDESPCGIANTSRVAAAAAVAAASDVTVLVVGDSSTILAGDQSRHQETSTCGEHFDRDSLDLAGAQLPLLRAVLDAAPGRVIVVLIHGRTVTFGAGAGDGYNSMFDATPAIIAAWRPGEEGGNALWGIINGTVNPSGRSAHTWPRTVGQVHQYVPWFLPWATRSTSDVYADQQPATPLVPFGFGLSYTNFTLRNARLSASRVAANASEPLSVQLQVASQGPAGKCVIQVYYSQSIASRVRFERMLLGFAKVDVPANSSGTNATVTIDVSGLEMWNKEQQAYVVESSNYTLYVALYSTDPHAQSLPLEVV